MDDDGRPARLGVLAFGLAFGAATAIAMLFLGIAASFGWGDRLVSVFSSLYLGFAPTVLGTILGMAWGFADGFIGGAIVAGLYNLAIGRR
jgi:ABC-type molybdate transport system permease subunit